MKISDWDAKIKNARKPVLAEFWAPWCGPCKIMEPRLIKTAGQYTGQVDLLRVNADQSQELIRKLNVMGIPTIIAFANGVETFRKVGLQNDQALEEIFTAAAQSRKPEFHLTARDRLLRGIIGLVVVAAGLASGPNYWILAFGGILSFSAVYDRCPIYRAVTARLRELFTPKQAGQV